MKTFLFSLLTMLSVAAPTAALAARPTPASAAVLCVVNPLHGTGGYQPYFLCTITKD